MTSLAILTKEDAAAAAKQGWTASIVYDTKTSKFVGMLLPVGAFTAACPHADFVQKLVIRNATTGDLVSKRALAAISDFNLNTRKKKK